MGRNKKNKHVLYRYNNPAPVICERPDWRNCPEHKNLTTKRPKANKFLDLEANIESAKKYKWVAPFVKIGLFGASILNAVLIPSAGGVPFLISVTSAFIFDTVSSVFKKPFLIFLKNKNIAKDKMDKFARRYKLATIAGSAAVSFSVTVATGFGGANSILAGAGGAIVSVIFSSITDRVSKKHDDEIYEKTAFPKAEARINGWLDRRVERLRDFTKNAIQRGDVVLGIIFGKEILSILVKGKIEFDDVSSRASDAKERIEDSILDNRHV